MSHFARFAPRTALAALGLLASAAPVHALTFNVTYDASTASAPAAFSTAFDSVLQFYQTNYSDPITINLTVGWGEVNGGPLASGNLGQSVTAQRAVSYAGLKAALTSDAKSTADATAVASLPAADPTPGINFAMSNAEAKALGLLAANNAALDGAVGFSSTAAFFFDPALGPTAGAYDFVGLVHHEITEVMGRYGYGQNGSGGRGSPIDLFRYLTSNGQRDLAPAFGTANYFSINGGSTAINTYNAACCGDLSDWAGGTLDAFNAFGTSGKVQPVSAGDRTLMDVLGYDPVVAVPEVSSAAMLAGGLAGLLALRRRRLRRAAAAANLATST